MTKNLRIESTGHDDLSVRNEEYGNTSIDVDFGIILPSADDVENIVIGNLQGLVPEGSSSRTKTPSKRCTWTSRIRRHAN